MQTSHLHRPQSRRLIRKSASRSVQISLQSHRTRRLARHSLRRATAPPVSPQAVQHLPQNPHPHRRIPRPQPHPPHQPPHDAPPRICRMPPRIPALFHHLQQQPASAAPLPPHSRLPQVDWVPRPSQPHRRPPASPSPAPTPYRHTATACPRFIEGCRTSACALHRNRHQPVAVAHLLVAQPRLLRPKQQRHLAPSRRFEQPPRSAPLPPQHVHRMLQQPLPHRRRPHHQRAVRHRLATLPNILRADSAPPKHRPPTSRPQTAPGSHSPPAVARSRSHASPAPPLRYSADCAPAPAPPPPAPASLHPLSAPSHLHCRLHKNAAGRSATPAGPPCFLRRTNIHRRGAVRRFFPPAPCRGRFRRSPRA